MLWFTVVVLSVNAALMCTVDISLSLGCRGGQLQWPADLVESHQQP